MTSAIQQKGLTKLLGLDYEVRYKSGAENRVADALSRQHEGLEEGALHSQGLLMVISMVTPTWTNEIVQSYTDDPFVQEVLTVLSVDSHGPNLWYYSMGVLRRKGKVYVGSNGSLRNQLISNFHDTPLGGNSGQLGTLKRVAQFFYWPKMKFMVNSYVSSCDVCQRNKDDNAAYPGLLQPLPMTNQAWRQISMDFIEGLPKSRAKDVILVVVDRFTKYAHFIDLSHPYTASTVANLYWKKIHNLHGIPDSIVIDRDKVFLSNFWQDMFKLLGTQLHYSSAYHPQSDGQTERVNRCLENYLRCMTTSRPIQWKQWFLAAEWWYNTNFHTSLRCTLFEALYGYTPPQLSIGPLLETIVQAAEDVVMQRQQFLQLLHDNLTTAQARIKFFADNRRTDREFSVGNSVYLKLQPYRQTSIALRKNLKLSSKYYGPYRITDRIGSVAYQLELPPHSKIHLVFHVSLLKRKVGNRVVVQSELPATSGDGQFLVKPVAILQRQMVKRNNMAVVRVLV